MHQMTSCVTFTTKENAGNNETVNYETVNSMYETCLIALFIVLLKKSPRLQVKEGTQQRIRLQMD